ncbi:hypothetical protein [Streptomyces ossamyceticus]|uniref:hypothetical protein n=1 Tax=Streptomyces ossamyceticus TaxID=249581 RepID=UPI003412C193
MSRRKPRKPRRERPGRGGEVFLQFEGGVKVRLPHFTGRQVARVKLLVEAGQVDADEVRRFIGAFARAVGEDIDFGQWTREDILRILRLPDFLPADEWTVLDDLEATRLLGGAR